MWRVGLRDLLHRKRRFVVAVLATAIAFGLALLLSGVLEHLEREAIQRALEKTRFNRTAAAKLLGITFRALRYRMQRLGLS